ncbi:MAG: glutaredoxin family protein [Mycobacteriaceae bacterium]
MVRVELLTRVGCSACQAAATDLARVCAEFGVAWSAVDVDHAAARHPELRAEYGDRLPVVLLDGREHSYLDVDEQRLRSDLASALGAPTDPDG